MLRIQTSTGVREVPLEPNELPWAKDGSLDRRALKDMVQVVADYNKQSVEFYATQQTANPKVIVADSELVSAFCPNEYGKFLVGESGDYRIWLNEKVESPAYVPMGKVSTKCYYISVIEYDKRISDFLKGFSGKSTTLKYLELDSEGYSWFGRRTVGFTLSSPRLEVNKIEY